MLFQGISPRPVTRTSLIKINIKNEITFYYLHIFIIGRKYQQVFWNEELELAVQKGKSHARKVSVL